MDIAYRWLPMDLIDLGQVSISKLWSPTHILAHDKDLFQWQYFNQNSGFFIAEDDDKIVGFIGVINSAAHNRGHLITGACIALYITDPQYRAKGVGLQLLKRAYAGRDLVITMGINRRVEKLYKMLGQEVVESMPRQM